MKKLSPLIENINNTTDFIEEQLKKCSTKEQFVTECSKKLSEMAIEFYGYVGMMLNHIGFSNTKVIREGDVNCRFDAIIIDTNNSIPIEIKSPKEDREINVKSIRQAFENKIVLLSRGFYPTQSETTSLAIAYKYPPSRSDIYELIVDIKNSFGFNIGIVNIIDLLKLTYDINQSSKVLDLNYFTHLQGKFDYEKAIIKK